MNPYAKFTQSHGQSKRRTAAANSKFFFVTFPSEETHGLWPEKLVRIDRKNKFSFEAKFGTKWYSCRIECQGSEEECRQAQVKYESQSNANRREWSSAETEESASSSSSDDNDSCIDEVENFDYRSPVKKRTSNTNPSKRKKDSHQPPMDSTYQPSIELLARISRDLNNLEQQGSNDVIPRTTQSDGRCSTMSPSVVRAGTTHATPSPSRLHSNDIDQQSNVHLSSSPSMNKRKRVLSTSQGVNSQEDIEDISGINDELKQLKRMMAKIYSLQKRSSVKEKTLPKAQAPPMVENNVNLMTLGGTTPSRFMLNCARVILSPEQLRNGFVPDFSGSRDGRIPIDESQVQTLKEAVQRRFEYSSSDMDALWSRVLRPSLGQKILDTKREEKRKSANLPTATDEHNND